MNIEILLEKAALKELVDTFSNLADEKRVSEQDDAEMINIYCSKRNRKKWIY